MEVSRRYSRNTRVGTITLVCCCVHVGSKHGVGTVGSHQCTLCRDSGSAVDGRFAVAVLVARQLRGRWPCLVGRWSSLSGMARLVKAYRDRGLSHLECRAAGAPNGLVGPSQSRSMGGRSWRELERSVRCCCFGICRVQYCTARLLHGSVSHSICLGAEDALASSLLSSVRSAERLEVGRCHHY